MNTRCPIPRVYTSNLRMQCWLATLLLLATFGHSACSNSSDEAAIKASDAACQKSLTPEFLVASLDAGTAFLLANQLDSGRFAYEYDWRTQQDDNDDHQVRQAGATWGLTLIYEYGRDPTVLGAAQNALVFFKEHSTLTADGRRFVVYPDDKYGHTGTVALVALAHIELLRTNPDPEYRAQLESDLDSYLAFLLHAVEDGRLPASYTHSDGSTYGDPSPYYEGEALLAFSKAAHYLGRDDLMETIQVVAEAGFQANVRDALAVNIDSPVTKGYYQWASMSYFEFTQAKWANHELYGNRLISLANWMIRQHRVLIRVNNTAYAFEGLIPALVEARRQGDEASIERIECAIHEGLTKLTSWQVGGPNPNAYILEQPTDDPRALGGVQNAKDEPGLRIDVTQHQTHALILALRHLFE